MKTRFFAFTAIAVLLFNVAALATGDTHRVRVKKRQAATRLVSLLPASDGVAVFDAKRFFDDALPKILSANQPMLAEITSKIAEMNDKAGIDIRKFEQVVVGFNMKKVSAKDPDVEPVAIVSGDINAGALLAIAKLASNGKYREEKVGETTVYIFTVKDAMKNMPANTSDSKIAGTIDKGVSELPQEVAVTALDQNTLAFGCIDRVRETLEAKSHVGADITDMLFARETAVMSYAVRIPDGMSKSLGLDADEIGKNVDSIQYVSGSLDVAVAGASLQVMARAKQPEQAQSLKSTLEGLQMIGKAIFGNSKRADQQVFGRMVKNVKIDARGNDVTLDLLVPQADIDVLIAGAKGKTTVQKPVAVVRKHRPVRRLK